MTKGLEVLESLDKLEECAYAMKDLPMSNWIDLAENEAELDLKIMDWVETIKLELFKGKQALQRLEAIDNSNPSEALKYVNGKIADLEDDLQHYTMVEKDKCKDFFIREDLKQFTTIKQALIKAQEQKNENKVLKACIKDWEDDYEHLKFASEKKEKALEIIKKKLVNVVDLYQCTDLYTYNSLVKGTFFDGVLRELIKEEFDLLKEVLEE